jgi:mannose-6-phosphate isomerase
VLLNPARLRTELNKPMVTPGQAMKLDGRLVEKPWGRTELPLGFGDTGGKRIGEIWFAGGEAGDLPLLLKYIFTSERLSIQVHPNDEQARASGLPHGKNECWYILDAEPDAVLGLGLKSPMTPAALRASILDGSIEQLIDWRPAQAGDVIYVPAGTIHAIGPGLSLIEVQQNIDVTYRLYDYGRPRDLHLDDGLKVARPLPYPDDFASHSAGGESRPLVSVAHFSLLRLSGDSGPADGLIDRQRWALPLEGVVLSNGASASPGECLFLAPGAPLDVPEHSLLLLAVAGPLP